MRLLTRMFLVALLVTGLTVAAYANGLNLTFSQILVRNLVRLVDMLPGGYLLGGCFALFTSKGQRLGDIAAGTVVISQREVSMPDIELLKPEQQKRGWCFLET